MFTMPTLVAWLPRERTGSEEHGVELDQGPVRRDALTSLELGLRVRVKSGRLGGARTIRCRRPRAGRCQCREQGR